MVVICPHCKQKIDASSVTPGISIVCPNCRGRFLPPDIPAAAAPVMESGDASAPAALEKAAFPPRLGTPWDFYGAGDTPGQGQIACGYFIAASLDAIGFNVGV